MIRNLPTLFNGTTKSRLEGIGRYGYMEVFECCVQSSNPRRLYSSCMGITMVFKNFFSTEVELLTGSNGLETFTSWFKDIICSPF